MHMAFRNFVSRFSSFGRTNCTKDFKDAEKMMAPLFSIFGVVDGSKHIWEPKLASLNCPDRSVITLFFYLRIQFIRILRLRFAKIYFRKHYFRKHIFSLQKQRMSNESTYQEKQLSTSPGVGVSGKYPKSRLEFKNIPGSEKIMIFLLKKSVFNESNPLMCISEIWYIININLYFFFRTSGSGMRDVAENWVKGAGGWKKMEGGEGRSYPCVPPSYKPPKKY